MSNAVIDKLISENCLLRDQLLQIQYYIAGSHGLSIKYSDVSVGQTINCDKTQIHNIASGLLKPALSCVDIGPGLRPQRLVGCNLHVLVESWGPYLQPLIHSYPGKVVIPQDGLSFLRGMPDKSIDTIFMLDLIEHLERDVGESIIIEACRVARIQVVIFTPLGFMPQENGDLDGEWGGVDHGDNQKHLSGWVPEDFSAATHVVCDSYHFDGGISYGAFYSIIDVEEFSEPRLILVSEEPPGSFAARSNDLIVVDFKYSELSFLINKIPKRNIMVFPFEMMWKHSDLPMEYLRHVMVNYSELKGYIERIKKIECHGIHAQGVLERFKQFYGV